MSSDTSRQRKGLCQKLKEKRAIEREHESNFKAGRVPIRERYLHRTGIRGRKRSIYYAFLYILAIVCIINLVILAVMLSVLRIDKSGMESLSLFKSGLVRWMYGGDLRHVVLKTGEIGAFKDKDLRIVGNNGKANFVHVIPGSLGSSAHFGPDETLLTAKNGVRIVSSEIDRTVLHIAEREVVWDVPARAKDLDTTHVVSHRITSDNGKDLHLNGKSNVKIRGNENVFIDSGRLNVTAEEGTITLKVGEKNTLTFDAPAYNFKNVSVATSASSRLEYRLCVCANNHKLFRIKAEVGKRCSNAIEFCTS